MIMGSRENKTIVQSMVPGTKKLSSTSDQFKSRAKCPVLVVRPAVSPAARGAGCNKQFASFTHAHAALQDAWGLSIS